MKPRNTSPPAIPSSYGWSRAWIAIETLKEQANYMLKHSRDDAAGERLGWGTMMLSVLQDTGNYHGYVYLTKADMVDSIEGHSVGVNDPTRIKYA